MILIVRWLHNIGFKLIIKLLYYIQFALLKFREENQDRSL